MEDKYLNFSILLIQDAFKNIRKTMVNIMNYAGYAHTLKLKNGNEEEQMRDAGSYLGITYGNEKRAYKIGETLYNNIPANSPMTGINKDMCFGFYNNHKTDDEIAVLLAFLALKSIIGTKPYCKVTNEYLLARMGGYASIKDMPDDLPQPLAQYSTRRKLDKIKIELQLNWNVNIYARYTRGFFVSIENQFSLDKLVFEVEKHRKSTKENQLREKIEDARSRALNKLYNDNKSFNDSESNF